MVSSPINKGQRAALDIPADISLIPKMREVRFEKNLKNKEGQPKEEPVDEEDEIIILDDNDSPKSKKTARQKTIDLNNRQHDDKAAEALCNFQRESITR